MLKKERDSVFLTENQYYMELGRFLSIIQIIYDIMANIRSITVYFDTEEFEALQKAKKDKSWHDYIIGFLEKPKGSKGAKTLSLLI